MNIKKIKIILVDDHAIVRAGFRLLLSNIDDIEVIAEAERGEQLMQLYADTQPDIVILDLSMPGIGGLETIRRIINRYNDAKILVFSVHNEWVYINRAIDAGASGYICKSSAPQCLLNAIYKIAAGEIYLEQVTEKQSIHSDMHYREVINHLSAREFDVFLLLAKGLNTHSIASELCLSYKTVANYSTQIKAKLAVATIAELVRIAMVLDIIKN